MSVDTFEALVRLLADGSWVSGEEIGLALKISRSGVWKRLQAFESYGLQVESVRGKGYRLSHSLDLLNADRIRGLMRPEALGFLEEVSVPFVMQSTNNALLSGGAKSFGVKPGTVCLTEYQSAGKGRRGRQWLSPLGGSVMMSVAWLFSGGAASLEGLSLAVGVAIVRTLEGLGVSGVRLKWPNDLVVEGRQGYRKLGGVLIELTGDVSGDCHVVVGLGLNVSLSKSSPSSKVPASVHSIDQPWVDLCQLGVKMERNALVAALLNEVLPMLARFEEKGFASYRDQWHNLNAHRNQQVCLVSPVGSVTGRCVSVSDSGALVLDTEAGLQQFTGGELSLRAALKTLSKASPE